MSKIYYVYNCQNCAETGHESFEINTNLDYTDLYMLILQTINNSNFNCTHCNAGKEFLRKKTICDADSMELVYTLVKNECK